MADSKNHSKKLLEVQTSRLVDRNAEINWVVERSVMERNVVVEASRRELHAVSLKRTAKL